MCPEIQAYSSHAARLFSFRLRFSVVVSSALPTGAPHIF